MESKEPRLNPQAREIMRSATENNPQLAWRKKIRELLNKLSNELEEFSIELEDEE